MLSIETFLKFKSDDEVVATLEHIAQQLRDRGWLTVMTGDDFADVLLQFQRLIKNKNQDFYLVISIVTSSKYAKNVSVENCKRVADFAVSELAHYAQNWDPTMKSALLGIIDCVVMVNGKYVV